MLPGSSGLLTNRLPLYGLTRVGSLPYHPTTWLKKLARLPVVMICCPAGPARMPAARVAERLTTCGSLWTCRRLIRRTKQSRLGQRGEVEIGPGREVGGQDLQRRRGGGVLEDVRPQDRRGLRLLRDELVARERRRRGHDVELKRRIVGGFVDRRSGGPRRGRSGPGGSGPGSIDRRNRGRSRWPGPRRWC